MKARTESAELFGAGKTRLPGTSPGVGDDSGEPGQRRQECRRGTQKCVRHMVLAAFSAMPLVCAMPAAIGVAMSNGAILLDNARTAGNATIFEGNTLDTQTEMLQVELKAGARVRLALSSRGKFYRDRVDLREGSARIWNFAAVVNGLTVRTEGMATVSLEGKVVEVAALRENVRVFSATGINVANVRAGGVLSLRMQDSGASPLSEMTGCVTKSGSGFLLNDGVTGVMVQLSGGQVRAGYMIRVTGLLVADPHEPISALRITRINELEGACGAGVVAAAVTGAAGVALGGPAVAGAASGAAAAGVSTTVAIAGTAAAGAAGTAVALIATRLSPLASDSATHPDRNCVLRRGRTCVTPSPTGSGSQSGQLSGGK